LAFKQIENAIRNEPATRRENVGVTIAVLLAAKETKRLDQTKVELGTRHGNAKDAAFFFDLLGAIRRHVGRYATIRDSQNVNHENLTAASGVLGR
jgi:hypothetical protein